MTIVSFWANHDDCSQKNWPPQIVVKSYIIKYILEGPTQ